MISLFLALTLVSPVLGAAQDPQSVNELGALVRNGTDSALVDRVRRLSADEVRGALRVLLASAARGGSESSRATSLAVAHRIAAAVAVARRDSFLLRQVARFRILSRAERQATIEADSLRRAGRAAFGTMGNDAAMRILREAMRRFEALADTSGISAAFRGLAVGFYFAQEYDSAEAYLTSAHSLAERIGDYYELGGVLSNLGVVNERRGELRRANELYASAKTIFEQIGDQDGLRKIQINLGVVASGLGDLAGARREWESALAASRSAGHAEDAALVLRNLGLLAAQEGDYAEAGDRYREALSTYQDAGNQLGAAVALLNLGRVATRRGDYPAAVRALSEAAAIVRHLGPGPDMNEIDPWVELAETRARMGDLQGARVELDWAEMVANRRGGAARGAALAALALTRGRLALNFNRFAEAERQFARAQRLAAGAADSVDRASFHFHARIGMADVFFGRESYQRAQVALERLLVSGSIDRHNAASIRLTISLAASRHGDTASARHVLRAALDTLRILGAVADEAQGLSQLGDLEAGAGRWFAAETLYRQGLTRLGTQPAPHVAWQLHAGLAASLRRRGARADATRELLAGIEQIERVSGGLALEEHRSAFQADKWDVYVDLALLEHERGRTEAAFEASERLRGRQMLDLLARGRIVEQGPLRKLAIREQDLRRKIGELAVQAGGTPPAAEAAQAMRDPASAKEATDRAAEEFARLQEDYGKLLLEIRSADPSYAALVRGETVRARAVMGVLGKDEALLEYLVGDSTTLVFIVTRDTVTALDLKLSHDALTAQVDFARSTLANPKEGATRRAWRPPLRRLFQQLFEPVERSGLLAGKRRLVIAPHAELHYLPFSALVRAGPPEQLLVERYLIDYVPSASVWLRLRDRSRPAPSGGILALAPRAKALPGSRSEVAAIRRIYGDRAETLVGTPATARAFRERAPEQEIVHLATYGVLNKHNPLFSYIELSKSPDEDGRLEVHEVFGLTLNARLLVLSACETGLAAGALGDVPPGDDWVGLVQGFLYAGAANVVATLWPVADVATARLMERFYRELFTGRSEAEALALAQRAAVRDPKLAHPFYWAGFTLVRGR
jgi:CHAT domain-containing protein/Tfp pilus assembly protein PilF